MKRTSVVRVAARSRRALWGSLVCGVCALTILAAGLWALTGVPVAEAEADHASVVVTSFYKLGVTTDGLHKVTYEALAAAGLPVDSLDPTTFQLYEQGVEIGRDIVDADGSGTFNAGDYILFYGRAVNTYFTGTNIYWLTYGGGTGLPLATRGAAPQPGLPPALAFAETIHLEQNTTWQRAVPVQGEVDRWYWRLYNSTCGLNRPGVFSTQVTTPDVAPGTYTATLTVRVRGYPDALQPFVTHQATFDINGTVVGAGTFLNTEELAASYPFSQNVLTGTLHTIRLTAPPCPLPNTSDYGLVNWFELTYYRAYTMPATGQFHFGVEAASSVVVTLTNGTDPATQVFDISNPLRPIRLTGVAVSPAAPYSFSFTHAVPTALSAAAVTPGRYVAAAPAQLLTPIMLGLDNPSNLRSPDEGADWIAITTAMLRPAAERLAAHRRTMQGFRTAVVDVQDIYDEFNGGLPDQEAIRRFIRHAYENWPRPAPRYVLLVGDGHYDPRNYLKINPTPPYHIPPYLAAVDPIDGVTAADHRYVAYDPVPPVEHPRSFMSLGRLPANTLAEANAMVDKTIGYETGSPDTGWNLNVLFVADDADNGGDFPTSSNRVYSNTHLLPNDFNRMRAYMGIDYTVASDVTTAIVNAINNGVLFVNYHGHGSQQRWAGEPLIQVNDLSRLTNAGKYPIMLPMTCLEGFFINPESNRQSFGETLVRKANSGAVASWSPTGKGIASGHDILFEAFYHAIFELGMTELGPVTDYAKDELYNSTSRFKDLIDTYILFGDPALIINLPAPDLWVQKAPAPGVQVALGAPITYTLTYGNRGMLTATGVVLTDTLPAELLNPTWTASQPGVSVITGTNLAWSLPDLAPGVSGTITLTAILDPQFTGTTVRNSAVIAGSQADGQGRGQDNGSIVESSLSRPTGRLTGRVYADINDNKQWDPGTESGLPGVTLLIYDASGALAGSRTSDDQGLWSLDLPLGVYTVTAPTTARGSYRLTVANAVVVDLDTPGDTISGLNFGYILPTGIELEYFRAQWVSGGIRVEWATRTENDIAVFDVFRSLDYFSQGDRLTASSIPASAPPGEGAAYAFTDGQPPAGSRVFYWLRVESASTSDLYWFGPAIVEPPYKLMLPFVARRR